MSPAFRTLIPAFALAATAFATDAAAQSDPSGHDLYLQLCATCHGSDLRGGLGPNLVDSEFIYGAERQSQVQVVRNGVPANGMPAFGDVLASAQIDDVLDFIQGATSDPSVAPNRTEDTLSTLDYSLNVEPFVDGLEVPWAIDFIDARTALVTERPGRLRVVENGRLLPDPVSGTPEVHSQGQGGLLDVTVGPDYAESGWIYLSYSHALSEAGSENAAAMTRVVRGRIRDHAWVDQEVVFEAPHDTYRQARQHFGSRVVFDPEGYLYFSIGDRGAGDQAQDLTRPNGKVHRLNPDGSIPADNPFLSVDGALPSIFSYGHRNPQGVAIHPETGDVWAVEHGPLGGDEMNRVLPGRNYGWPVISYGINYNGTVMTEYRRRLGMEQPVHYWRPSIAVSGLTFYDGEAFPLWRGHALVGALNFEEVRLLDVANDRVMHQEILLKDAGRVREAAVGPDGAIYVVLNEPDRVVRLTPRAVAIRGR